jgi:hypothetical protein
VFGRTKTPADVSPTSKAAVDGAVIGAVDTPEARAAAGKGKPTPKRREAEQANRRPLIGSAAATKAAQDLAKAGTKEERKAAKAAQREAVRQQRQRTQQALVTGDERQMPARDRGPVRRYARDFVDSRRWAAEFVLPFALVVVVVGLFAQQLVVITTMMLYALIIVVIFDIGRLRGRLRRELQAKFGDKATKKDVSYGMMRALQIRRMRLPKPQVTRGQHPS